MNVASFDKYEVTAPTYDDVAEQYAKIRTQLDNAASYPAMGKLNTFRDIGKAAADVDKLVTDLKTAAAK